MKVIFPPGIDYQGLYVWYGRLHSNKLSRDSRVITYALLYELFLAVYLSNIWLEIIWYIHHESTFTALVRWAKTLKAHTAPSRSTASFRNSHNNRYVRHHFVISFYTFLKTQFTVVTFHPGDGDRISLILV